MIITAFGQGVFVGSNLYGPTRIGFADGPLAGTSIAGQMLGGTQQTSLQPVGALAYHHNGEFAAGLITVPGVSPYQFAFVQLVAWDSTIFGANLSAVPQDQLGRTDIVEVFLTTGVFPDTAYFPVFTQPVIIPISEPTGLAFGVLALGMLGMTRAVRRLYHAT